MTGRALAWKSREFKGFQGVRVVEFEML